MIVQMKSNHDNHRVESKCLQNWKCKWNELFHLEYKIQNDLNKEWSFIFSWWYKIKSKCTSNVASQKAWKIWDNKVWLDIVFNLWNIQVKAMHPHKIVKTIWDAIKTMHENVDKAFVVVLNQIFYKL